MCSATHMQPRGPLVTHYVCRRSGEARAHPRSAGPPTEVKAMSTTIRSTVTAISLSAVVAAAAVIGFALANDDSATAVTVTQTKPATTAPPGSRPAVAPDQALLGAGQMPRVNEIQTWTVANGEATFVAFDGTGLGANDTARRDFAMPGGKSANVVLTFTDEAAAKAAYDDIVTSTKADLEAGLPAGG